MRQRISFMLVGILISCAVLGAEIEPVRVKRYLALAPGPLPEQADPFVLPIRMQFSPSVPIVGAALHYVLAKSGYRLWRPSQPPVPRCLPSWPGPYLRCIFSPPVCKQEGMCMPGRRGPAVLAHVPAGRYR